MSAESMPPVFSLSKYDITVKTIYRNASPALLYELALKNEPGTAISSTGALTSSPSAR